MVNSIPHLVVGGFLGAGVPTHPRTLYQFGPFEVNLTLGELLKNGRRIKLQEQPYRILVALLEHSGEVISREELRNRLWPEDTFVDFDGSLRVAVRKLREALGDDAERPRYIQTHPGRGYRFIGSPQASDAPPLYPLAAINSDNEPKANWARKPLWLAFAVICLVLFGVGRLRIRTCPITPEWKVSQLTTDAGLSDAPAMSRDGKLVAYSSDRSSEGGRDLYVKQISGGPPIRLTSDGAGNTTPGFFAGREQDRLSVKPGRWRHLRDSSARRRDEIAREAWVEPPVLPGRLAGSLLGRRHKCGLYDTRKRRGMGNLSSWRPAVAYRRELYKCSLSHLVTRRKTTSSGRLRFR